MTTESPRHVTRLVGQYTLSSDGQRVWVYRSDEPLDAWDPVNGFEEASQRSGRPSRILPPDLPLLSVECCRVLLMARGDIERKATPQRLAVYGARFTRGDAKPPTYRWGPVRLSTDWTRWFAQTEDSFAFGDTPEEALAEMVRNSDMVRLGPSGVLEDVTDA